MGAARLVPPSSNRYPGRSSESITHTPVLGSASHETSGVDRAPKLTPLLDWKDGVASYLLTPPVLPILALPGSLPKLQPISLPYLPAMDRVYRLVPPTATTLGEEDG